MLYAAKNGTAAGADYIRFGRGKKNLILLPGLGDGLRTTKGTALPMALYYRRLTGEYTVYMFSRKRELSEGDTTRDLRFVSVAVFALATALKILFHLSQQGLKFGLCVQAKIRVLLHLKAAKMLALAVKSVKVFALRVPLRLRTI